MHIRGVLSLVILMTTNAWAGAIFGTDDRVSVLPNSNWSRATRSTAVAVLSSNIEDTGPETFNLKTDSMHEFLCPGQRFRDEPSLSYACTGFLVAPNLIATAGHCMVNTGETRNETEMFCSVFSWLFDYRKNGASITPTQGLSKDKLYRCKKIIYAVKDERAPFRDYALVELDREVADREPLPLDTSRIRANAKVGMVGHPMGMPAQSVSDASILLNDESRQSFITNLDAIEGNSGSPVFNSRGKVVGILVGGTPTQSFVDQPQRCAVMNRCAENGSQCIEPEPNTSIFPGFQHFGAEVQRIQPIKDLTDI